MPGLTRFELLRGVDKPPPELRTLRAGPLTAVLDGIDLRWIRSGNVELIRRIYAAVRDLRWGTLAHEVENLRLDASKDRFLLKFDVRNRDANIDLSWHGRVEGSDRGTIVYDFDACAEAAFDYGRIGLCVLHPPSGSAGRVYRAVTESGQETGVLPELVAPQEVVDGIFTGLFPPFTALSISLASGGEVRFAFEGDLFEMEDQRNWADGSFKTYSTPLALGEWHHAERGTRIQQRVITSASAVPKSRRSRASPVLVVGEPTVRMLPTIGFGMASDGSLLSARAVEIVRSAGPDHIRTDLDLGDPSHECQLDRALTTCEALGCALELALFVDACSDSALAALALRLRDAPVARILAFASEQWPGSPTETTPPAVMELVRARLGPTLPAIPFGGGTDMYFAELNRTRPDASLMDEIAYAVMPQMHADDDLSLFESLEAQGDTVRTALILSAGKRIAVSPITLRHRKATYGAIEAAPGTLPFQVDPRQASRLLAAWTLGSVKYCAEAGASSLTYFETSGWRGIVESECGPALPELFPSSPGMVFPVQTLFRELAGHKSARIVACTSSEPLQTVGLCLQHEHCATLLAGNLTPLGIKVRHEATVAATVRTIIGEAAGDSHELALGPYAVCALDDVS